MAKRVFIFVYGLVSYAMCLGVFVYAFGFIGNVFVPKSIDSPREGTLAAALLVNLGLLVLFSIQHSVMARPTFKRWWTRVVPEPAERSTYVLFSNICMLLMFWLWRPMGGVVWDIHDPFGRNLILAVYAAGWAVVFISTALINHFDLFGLRQVWLYLQGREYTPLPFQTPVFYRFIRHPLYVGWLMVFWSAPTMTLAHLVFALATTAYILIAIQFEERNLVEYHGAKYADYRQRVPMLIPRFARPRTEQHPVTVPTP